MGILAIARRTMAALLVVSAAVSDVRAQNGAPPCLPLGTEVALTGTLEQRVSSTGVGAAPRTNDVGRSIRLVLAQPICTSSSAAADGPHIATVEVIAEPDADGVSDANIGQVVTLRGRLVEDPIHGARLDMRPQSNRSREWLAGVHGSRLLRVSAHFAFFPRAVSHPHGFDGVFLSFEPGVSGGLLGVGYGGLDWGTQFVRLAVLRTWGSPGGTAPGRTFIGPDLRLGFALSLGVGWYKRISGSAPGDESLWNFTAGYAF